MKSFLINLAKSHYSLGLINTNEFNERIAVANWLSDEIKRDSYQKQSEEKSTEVFEYDEDLLTHSTTTPLSHDDEWFQFVCLDKWVFTKSDPDSYPSVPHGHYECQNKKWPKLNPYTGQVFYAKGKEDKSKRLNKKRMTIIWSDSKFKTFCQEMVAWYLDKNRNYKSAVNSLK